MSESDDQRILSATEIGQLLAVVDDRFDEMLIKTCLYHGLRNQETVTLKRKHIDLEQIGVNIKRKNTKTESGKRKVPTVSHFKAEFKDYVESNTEDPEDYLFPSPRTDRNITERYFQERMLDYAWNAGLYPTLSSKEEVRNTVDESERVRPHCLRHTYGTKMYENGTKPKELSDVMGHEDLETTMNLYAHLANERSRDMLDKAANKWK